MTDTAIPSTTIAPLRRGTAEKASGTKIEYEVGREVGSDRLYLRLAVNEGGGTFSKEWVPFARLRALAEDLAKKGEPFSPGAAVAAAYAGKSRNNGPFLAYALKAEGLLAPAGEKGTQAAVAGDWSAWEKKALALPVPKIEPPPAKAEGAPGKPGRTGTKTGGAEDGAPGTATKPKKTPKKPAAVGPEEGGTPASATEN